MSLANYWKRWHWEPLVHIVITHVMLEGANAKQEVELKFKPALCWYKAWSLDQGAECIVVEWVTFEREHITCRRCAQLWDERH